MGKDEESLIKLREAQDKKNGRLKHVQSVFGVMFLIVCFLLVMMILLSYSGGTFTDTMSLARAAFSGMPQSAYAGLLTGTEEQMATVRAPMNTLNAFFGLKDIQLELDDDDPDVFHYSCTVPGPCNAAYELLLCKNITNDSRVSPRIEMSGTMRVVRTPEGKRRIDLGDGCNPLWLRAYVSHVGADGTLPYYNPSGAYTSEDTFRETQIGILQLVGIAYAEALNSEAFIGDVLLVQLTEYVDFLNTAPAYSTQPDYGERLPIAVITESIRIPVLACAGVLAVLLIVIIILTVKRIQTRLESDEYAAELREIESDKRYRMIERNQLDRKKEELRIKRETIAEEGRELRLRITAAKKANPEKKFLYDLNNDFEQAQQHTSGENSITRGGWSLMALIRGMVSEFTLKTREETAPQLKVILEEHDALAKEYNACVKEFRPLQRKVYRLLSDEERTKLEKLKIDIKRLAERLEGGIIKKCLDANCVPVDYFVNLACDRHGTERFLRQCALIGILPWMEANQSDPQIAQRLEKLYTAREEMISGAAQMAFFEVRVPPDCEVEEYAELLGETLRYANPRISYCNISSLMARAAKEVPGLMELLRLYPLRLIDDKNGSTEGFFEFRPYIHTMWVQYQPPLNVGQVQRRYHEALDMTKPNASGINIRLFEDEYSVVPVFFHEYCHYCGDHNEASVWLRTQLFSQQFYKKYEDADPTADYTFVHMQNLLGSKPNPDKTEELGVFIEKFYGRQVSQDEGNQIALSNILQINMQVMASNRTTTWCPEVEFLKLSDQEPDDTATYHVITRAVVRYATMPRKISREQFVAVVNHYMPDQDAENDSFYRNETSPAIYSGDLQDMMQSLLNSQ